MVASDIYKVRELRILLSPSSTLHFCVRLFVRLSEEILKMLRVDLLK